MPATLYVIPGSHPSMAARLMLDHKGMDYRRVDLMPVISKGVLKALRFPAATVPALRMNGRRIQGSTRIARELDRLRPEPPLFPGDPERRAAVQEAERWGDETFQSMTRRILWGAINRDRSSIGTYAEGARLGIPIGLAVRTAAPIVAASVRINRASDENVRADLAALPGALERIDDWLGEGVIGGESPNAADFQLATSVRLLMTLDDLRPEIEGHPAGELALRIVPEFPGRAAPVLPGTWLEPMRTARAAVRSG
jgi:glutathione S-transferase